MFNWDLKHRTMFKWKTEYMICLFEGFLLQVTKAFYTNQVFTSPMRELLNFLRNSISIQIPNSIFKVNFKFKFKFNLIQILSINFLRDFWNPVVSFKRFFKIPKTKGGIKWSKLFLERNHFRCSARIYFGTSFVIDLY